MPLPIDNADNSSLGNRNTSRAAFAGNGQDSQGKSNFNQIPAINLPKGGGAIKGIDEKFQVNAFSGTSGFSIPIVFSPGRGGYMPGIGLSYNSGSGNSPFGMGWQLGVQSIVRKTDNGLPQYQDDLESDTFMLSGTEDLVPVLQNNGGNWERTPVPPNAFNAGFTVMLYQPRVEGIFARIEKWTNNITAESHWRVMNADNSTSFFGLTAQSRISNPAVPGNVYEWLLCQTQDDKGNITLYSYKFEDFAGIPNKLNEKNRQHNCTQVYLKTILYGNKTPYVAGTQAPSEDQFMFKVIFDYGEHDAATPVPMDVYQEKNTWACRQDPFSSYRPGFELRTYRRCSRVLMFHCFEAPEMPVNPYLVNSLQLFYNEDLQLIGNGSQLNGFSFLTKARQNGHIWHAEAQSYTTKSLPDMDMAYQQHEWNVKVENVAGDSLMNAPIGIDDKSYLWVDLFSEGIAGILTEQGDGWYYKSNLGDGGFTPAIAVAQKPNFTGLADGTLSVQELEGDGVKYLVQTARQPQGFFRLNDDASWQNMKAFESFPVADFNTPNSRFVDLNADGRPELLYTDDNLFRWYESAGEQGFKVSGTVIKEFDEEKGPAVVFADATQSIFLADMSGDGLTDILRVRNGEVCYWPNLGYGRFGAKVAMDNAPIFDTQDGFNPAFLRLADIDGSGTTDVVYLGHNNFSVWANINGNEWTAGPQTIAAFPQVNNYADIQVLDFLGSGTACIVYSSPFAAQPLQYINLMGSKKPGLLTGYRNNCGMETALEYKSSTEYYLADKLAGIQWVTKLPFPVLCVSKVTVSDKVRETVFVSGYSYRHGFYDAIEKEFRGFARVEQYDTEAFEAFALNSAKNVVEQDLHQPPVRTVSWYHTGAFLRGEKILHQCESEYFQNTSHPEYSIPEPLLPAAVPAVNLHEAYRACKGILLRAEVYADDASALKDVPYSVSQASAQIILLQPGGPNYYASFMVIPGESISYNYERLDADPRITHSFVLAADQYGNITQSASVVYPRVKRPSAPNDVPDKVWDEQNKLYIKYNDDLFTNDVIDDTRYRLRSCYETKDYELSGIVQPAGFYLTLDLVNAGIAAATEIAYEQDFGSGLQKRLLSRGRVYFATDDLLSSRPLGELSPLGIPHKTYQLAFTSGLVPKYYGAKVTDLMLQQAMYTHLEGDNDWWTQSGTLVYAPVPSSNFYIPVAATDVFGRTGQVAYDSFNLLVQSTTDAINNTVTVNNNYRTLMPAMVTDQNLNRTAVEYDELGMVIKSAVMGKQGGNDGDTLADPTIKMDYNVLNWQNNGQPNYSHIQGRETHGPANTKWIESFVYSDGSGSVVMTKAQVAPGPARKWNSATNTVDEITANPRWIGNGRTILNNKGNPVKKYEPYFSDNSGYETEDALVETGVTPVLYYDPVGRNICTDYPNGTFSKIEFDSWAQKNYDVNDTVKDSQWYIDRGSPDPSVTPEPTNPETRAAWLAAKCYNTPGIVHTDSLGRTFYNIADYGGGITSSTYTLSDFSGRFSMLYDQLGRNAGSSFTNLIGQSIKSIGAEKGTKWVLYDVQGRIVKVWDNDVFEFRTSYDKLDRPLSSYVKQSGTETVINSVVYGDVLDPATAQNLNMKGRAYQVYDQAGMVCMQSVDFKGNVLSTARQLCKDYQNAPDWTVVDNLTDITAIQAAAKTLLDTSETFVASATFDALNRPVSTKLPDNSVVTPIYDDGNYLASLSVNIRGANSATDFLTGQAYNEKGQRSYAQYGCGAVTNYVYDPATFRLTNITTKQNAADADSIALQNLNYYFDPIGNITQVRDDAQQTRYFKNAVIYPENKYQYDALYQLATATGREHSGLGTDTQPDNNDVPVFGPVPELNNANAVRNYTENYQYDICGNILSMQHVATGGNWTRRYKYQYQDDPSDNTNRLKATSLPGDAAGVFSALYNYGGGADNGLHGNMTAMPHLPAPNSLVWNFSDQLSKAGLGGGGTAYYVYGTGGGRVRQVIERQGGKIIERIYLGAVEIYRERQGAAAPDLERYTLHISDNTGRIAQVDTKTIDKNNKDTVNPLNVPLVRYQFNNHLGSAVLDLDNKGNIIFYEEYHPFGTSSYRVSQSGWDASLKRYRFSGKERDEGTGLYYFGARYYAAWLGRWTSSDPGGFISGTNLFRYCSNNPVMLHDPNGMEDEPLKIVVRDTKLNKDAKFSDLVAAVPKGYHIRAGIDETNYKQNWDSEAEVYNILEKDAPGPSPSDGGGGAGDAPDAGTNSGGAPDAGNGGAGGAPNSSKDDGTGGAPNKYDDGAEGSGPGNGIPDSGAAKDDSVGEPGMLESLIPIWGSGRESINHFQHGNYIRGILWGAMAISDIFLVKSIVMGGVKLLARGAAKVALEEGAELATKGGTETVVHMTNATAEEGIKSSGKLGGKWGIFALDASKVPKNPGSWMRNVKSLVPGNLSRSIEIGGDATKAFQRPPIFGPFSGVRRLWGVQSTRLGSIDLTAGRFIEGEIFKNGVFREATLGERAMFESHQWLLDYGVDGLLFTVGKVTLFNNDMADGVYSNPSLTFNPVFPNQ